MDTFPPEIWSHIFWHACTDTGYTGRAISETCRSFNDVGKLVKFRSVALQGLSQVTSFWNSIKSLPPYHRQIENMYMFVAQYDADVDDESETNRLPISGADESTVDKTLFSTIVDVLTAAAPSLVYLYLYLEMNRETLFLPIEFPLLSELVIYGHFNDFDDTKTGKMPTLVNLRKLRIFGYGDDKAIFALPTCAPYLTHLRLDRRNAYASSFISTLKDVLQSSTYSPDQFDLKFPASLEKLLIHPGLVYRPMCGYGFMNLRRSQAALANLMESDKRIFLLDQDPEDDENTQLEGLEEWLDRIDGKLAYWEEKNSAQN